jgi:predicted small integral membrane protein
VSLGRIALFLVFAGGIMGSLHYYAWTRLVRDPQLPAPWSSVATAVIVVLGVLLVAAFPLSLVLPRSVSGPLTWIAFTWMGFAFFLVVLLAVTDLARLAALVGVSLLDGPELDRGRRLFIGRAVAALVAVASLGLGAAGLREGLRQVRVKKIRIALRRIQPKKVGYRIVQLTDIHVGPTIGRKFIEQIVAQTNALEPDVVVITGDLVDGSVAVLRDAVAPLAGLKAKDGVFFVTGNHEYYSGVDEWLAHLPSLGIRVLRNERVVLGERPRRRRGSDRARRRRRLERAGLRSRPRSKPRPGARGEGPRPGARPPRPSAEADHRGRAGGRRPPALGPHARRPDVPLRLARRAPAALRRRLLHARGDGPLREPGHGVLGPSDAPRLAGRDHPDRARDVVT